MKNVARMILNVLTNMIVSFGQGIAVVALLVITALALVAGVIAGAVTLVIENIASAVISVSSFIWNAIGFGKNNNEPVTLEGGFLVLHVA